MLSLPHPTLLRMPQDQAVFAVSLSMLIWKRSSTPVCSLREHAGILISDVVERAKLLPQRCRVTRGILSQKLFSPSHLPFPYRPGPFFITQARNVDTIFALLLSFVAYIRSINKCSFYSSVF